MSEIDTARERTRLAWRRTFLATTVVVILGARLAVVRTSPGFAALVVSLSAGRLAGLFRPDPAADRSTDARS